ncbi:MAG: 5-bromo-4-chloroindolyl phosphate hydrolysis family protein [Lachnospiraceae bacterium]|nr:5-bromo-4-chloroindolyl phosphate hydrolysis family protein [Lachnospiraceae bacterium]
MKNVIQDSVAGVADTVASAVSSGNYSNLSADVSRELEELFANIGRTVNMNLNGVGQSIQQGQYGYRNPVNESGWKDTYTSQRIQRINEARQQAIKHGAAAPGANYVTPLSNRPPAQYRNLNNEKLLATLGVVFGTAATIVFLPICMLIMGGIGALGAISLIFPAGTAAAASFSGSSLGIMKRFEEYVGILQGRSYADVETLAAVSGRSAKAVRKDLKKMIKKGWFLQGHLDGSESTLITSNETYQQYQDTARAAEERAKEEGGLSEEQKEIFRLGELYIAEIRQCNQDIPDVDISAKLDRMEHSVRQIVERAKQKPTLTQDLRRLMNYYLPTMVKLLHSYVELEKQDKTSSNIEKSKREIENTIDMMNDAFDRLFDDLFDDTSLDISTDAEVMRQLLEQEGLTGHSFSENQSLLKEGGN